MTPATSFKRFRDPRYASGGNTVLGAQFLLLNGETAIAAFSNIDLHDSYALHLGDRIGLADIGHQASMIEIGAGTAVYPNSRLWYGARRRR